MDGAGGDGLDGFRSRDSSNAEDFDEQSDDLLNWLLFNAGSIDPAYQDANGAGQAPPGSAADVPHEIPAAWPDDDLSMLGVDGLPTLPGLTVPAEMGPFVTGSNDDPNAFPAAAAAAAAGAAAASPSPALLPGSAPPRPAAAAATPLGGAGLPGAMSGFPMGSVGGLGPMGVGMVMTPNGPVAVPIPMQMYSPELQAQMAAMAAKLHQEQGTHGLPLQSNQPLPIQPMPPGGIIPSPLPLLPLHGGAMGGGGGGGGGSGGSFSRMPAYNVAAGDDGTKFAGGSAAGKRRRIPSSSSLQASTVAAAGAAGATSGAGERDGRDTAAAAAAAGGRRRKRPAIDELEAHAKMLREENERLRLHLANVHEKARLVEGRKRQMEADIEAQLEAARRRQGGDGSSGGDSSSGGRGGGKSGSGRGGGGGGAEDSSLLTLLWRFKELYADYGEHRRKEVDFHLQQLEAYIVPTQVTKMSLWTLEQDDSFFLNRKKGTLLHILTSELGVSEEQIRRLQERRQRIKPLIAELRKSVRLVERLRQLVADKHSSFDQRMAEVQAVLTPTQVARLILWVQRSRDQLTALLPSLASYGVVPTLAAGAAAGPAAGGSAAAVGVSVAAAAAAGAAAGPPRMPPANGFAAAGAGAPAVAAGVKPPAVAAAEGVIAALPMSPLMPPGIAATAAPAQALVARSSDNGWSAPAAGTEALPLPSATQVGQAAAAMGKGIVV